MGRVRQLSDGSEATASEMRDLAHKAEGTQSKLVRSFDRPKGVTGAASGETVIASVDRRDQEASVSNAEAVRPGRAKREPTT